MILTQEQLIDLTGFKRAHKQREALDFMGIRYHTRLDGKPVVDDSALTNGKKRSSEPNWSAM